MHCTVQYSTLQKKEYHFHMTPFLILFFNYHFQIFIGILCKLDYQVGDFLSANICIESGMEVFSSSGEAFSITP
jgi:hypothetical protein